jgi:hypothetical protein
VLGIGKRAEWTPAHCVKDRQSKQTTSDSAIDKGCSDVPRLWSRLTNLNIDKVVVVKRARQLLTPADQHRCRSANGAFVHGKVECHGIVSSHA